MSASTPPHKGMLMRIPVRRRCLDRLNDLLPGFKTSALERERTEDFPPRLNEVQVRGVLGLVDELRARMMDQEQEQVVAMVHIQVVHDGIDTLHFLRDLLIDKTKEIDEMLFDAPGIALRPAGSGGFPQRSIDVAFGAPSIINLLFGSLGWTSLDINRLLTGITFGGHRPHLIDVQDDAVRRRFPSQTFERPLF